MNLGDEYFRLAWARFLAYIERLKPQWPKTNHQ
jgi:hypothetical protein